MSLAKLCSNGRCYSTRCYSTRAYSTQAPIRRAHKMYKLPYSPAAYKNRLRFDSNFADLKIVKLASGNGGNGRVSFFRDAGRSVGPPDGGDGGDGGDIYLQPVEGDHSLHRIRHQYRAENGSSGGTRQLTGANGKHTVIRVPVGTVVKWIPDPRLLPPEANEVEVDTVRDVYSGSPNYIQLHRKQIQDGVEGWVFKDKDREFQESQEYFAELQQKVKFYDLDLRRQELLQDQFPWNGIDLSKPGPPVLLLRGGEGGMGNMHFHTKTIRNPRFAREGRFGIEAHFLLELKLIADLGLVGLPNAGKSTLLRAISNAQPKVGHWEFTTLFPTVGTILPAIDKPSFSVADIPGIIKGSSDNLGMGLDFLRHVERSKAIAFIIALDRENPVNDLETLIAELGQRLVNKRALVIATKADCEGAQDRFAELSKYVLAKNWKIAPCCALDSGNIQAVIDSMASTVH